MALTCPLWLTWWTLRYEWKWKCQSLSHVWLFATPWTAALCSFPVHYQLLELVHTHIHRVSDATQPSHPLLSSFPPAFNHWSFPMIQFFPSGGQRIGASALASVLSMIIQGWFPLGLTGLILQSTGVDLQESSPVPQFKSINFSALSRLYGPTFIFIHNYRKNHSFDYMDLCRQNDVSAFLIHCLGLL